MSGQKIFLLLMIVVVAGLLIYTAMYFNPVLTWKLVAAPTVVGFFSALVIDFIMDTVK